MKIKIINSKNLDLKCLSALRYLGHCELCNRVKSCKLPEGIDGYIKFIETQIINLKNEIKEKQTEINKINKQLNELNK